MSARILHPSEDHVDLAARALRDGGVVGMPTETVYGLAADAFQPEAVAKIYEAKERPSFDPLIVHVAPAEKPMAMLARMGLVDLTKIPATVQAETERLIAGFWPGPFTLVLPRGQRVPDIVTSGLPTVGIRMPAHPVAQALIRAARSPLAAPSANRFGRISPTTADAVLEELGERIPYILDGGPCSVGVESTILGLGDGSVWKLLRPGGTPVEDLEKALGREIARVDASTSRPEAPGMLESHYAPTKPLTLFRDKVFKLSDDEIRAIVPSGKRLGFLMVEGDELHTKARLELLAGSAIRSILLSPAGDLAEAAAGLFSALRELDQGDCDVILAEPCAADRGLGYAIMDRLTRASAKRN